MNRHAVAAVDKDELMAFAARTRERLEAVMRQDLQQALVDTDPLLPEVLHYALFSGGKRIRPLLAILSSRICGRDDASLSLLATAFEYLHVATLIHDDVIDHAELRRGRPSVISRYGLAAAILAGDWLHARSMHIMGRLVGSSGLEIFSQATAAMVDGEFLQLRHCGNPDMDETAYFAIIARKTASLIGSTCAIGALYGGGDLQQQQALALYGQRIGTAFQIIDDLLDYLGDQKKTGKQTNNDFVEGKLTLPLLRARATGNTTDRDAITKLIQDDRTSTAVQEKLYDLVEKNKGFQAAREQATRMIHQAVSALDIFTGKDEAIPSHRLLCGLALYILNRNQ